MGFTGPVGLTGFSRACRTCGFQRAYTVYGIDLFVCFVRASLRRWTRLGSVGGCSRSLYNLHGCCCSFVYNRAGKALGFRIYGLGDLGFVECSIKLLGLWGCKRSLVDHDPLITEHDP